VGQEVVRLRAESAVHALRPWQMQTALGSLHAAFRTAAVDTKSAFCKQLLVLSLRCPQLTGTDHSRAAS
jgi:hypothetical protein